MLGLAPASRFTAGCGTATASRFTAGCGTATASRFTAGCGKTTAPYVAKTARPYPLTDEIFVAEAGKPLRLALPDEIAQ
jgi:hypothetical protein